jgi:hypothetical protein
MTKKELIEMLSEIPDNTKIQITSERSDLLSHWINAVDIKGFYEHNGSYILCSQNVRPYIIKDND